ncbi:hypothetical protein M501DRAFT_1016660 [Patellaria atrata CBS 101060]|uniref:Ribosome assembly protein 3 n=1 Tax=Patellaria atrata CBS 101060 TaxID=1346257 RepID=A0A9P4S9P1_9PEZI|nr:hypothetical protein M501DRAFT_1016660 [Patellaria atrata CBS 101060]
MTATKDESDRRSRRKKNKKRTQVSSDEDPQSSAAENQVENQSKVIDSKQKRKLRSGEKYDEVHESEEVDIPKPKKEKRKKSKSKPADQTVNDDVEMSSAITQPSQPPTEKLDFSALYLRRITKELAEDLDKVRSAGDFKDTSLPILVHALKQGEACFSPEAKARIVGR